MAARVEKQFVTRKWTRSRGGSPAAAVAGADVVVLMLRDGAALREALGGPGGVLASLSPGALVIDMSTSGRRAALDAARAVEAAGGRFLDAPVSGSVGPAQRGELVALVGGANDDVERARPVLAAMCARIVHAGGVGQGQALKVVLNGVGAHHVVAFTSMLALGERAGLSRQAIVEAFTTGAFATPSYVSKKAMVLARDYGSSEFTLDLTEKDAALNLELQRDVGMDLPVVREIAREIAAAIDEGLGDRDLFALDEHFQRRAGGKV